MNVSSRLLLGTPWKQSASRHAFDLINPSANDIDFDVDIAGPLSRLARFTGDIRGGAYSVAQHCVIGADIIAETCGIKDAAAAFLLHDAHEAYIGDIATPAQDAINWHLQAVLDDYGFTEMICRNVPDLAGPALFERALRRLRATLDEAIYASAGVSWPLTDNIGHIVRRMDLIMLAAEVDAFMGGELEPWGSTASIRTSYDIPGVTSRLVNEGIWPADVAEERYQAALRRHLPARFPHPAFSIEE